MPNKYFTLDTIKEAVVRLNSFERKWLLIPLVLAVNGVTAASVVDLQSPSKKGTDKFLKKFFSASLLALESKKPGNPSSITPLFADLVADQPDQLGKQTDGNLWGNNFSVAGAGYGQLRDGNILAKTTGRSFQLGPGFTAWFQSALPNFKLEDLLVWLYAFSGFPDTISNWQELLDHFLASETAVPGGFPTEYQTVFRLTPAWPWPPTFLSAKPTDTQFQDLLLPGSSRSEIDPAAFDALRATLADLLKKNYLGFSSNELEELALSVASSLQSCRRLFLLGEPGTGKTQLALLISAAFDQVFENRVLTVVAPIADGTTSDKLIGFSTLDGTWVDGMLTQADGATKRQLLYGAPNGASLKQFAREQVNVILLDEVNRRDAEDLLAKLQNALDSEHSVPEHISNQVRLDNAGVRYLSPNTFLIMSGNSPRDDNGRVVQSRPFKRRHNLIVVRNVFEKLLDLPAGQFGSELATLWTKRGTNFSIEPDKAQAFSDALVAEHGTVGALQISLRAMRGYGIGLSYGLAKKLLQTAGARFAMGSDFRSSIDYALLESVLPLLSSEVVINGRGVRENLAELDPLLRTTQLPAFFSAVELVLSPPDSFGRVRQFI